MRGAIGYDAARGDLVEVQLRGFAPPPAEPTAPWFQAPAVKDNAPYIAIAIVVAGGIVALVLMRRRKAAAVAAAAALPASGAAPAAASGRDGEPLVPIPEGLAPPIDGGMLTPAGAMQLVDYSAKLGTTREIVDGDADRATAVARQMLAAT